MIIRVSTRTLALLMTATIIGICEEAPNQSLKTFPKWAFCIAYQVRDADVRDARPIDPKAEKDPLNDKDTRIPFGLLNERNVVDVAALSTRLVKSGILSKHAAEEVIQSSTQGTEQHPVMDCYDPHHVFVFYGYEGNPIAAIEVCFSCNRVKMSPESKIGEGASGPLETADLGMLAKIATEAGLDLKPFTSLDAYLQRLDKGKEQVKEFEARLDAPGTGTPKIE